MGISDFSTAAKWARENECVGMNRTYVYVVVRGHLQVLNPSSCVLVQMDIHAMNWHATFGKEQSCRCHSVDLRTTLPKV